MLSHISVCLVNSCCRILLLSGQLSVYVTVTDEACRAVFEKHPDAKENAFVTAKKRRGSGSKADLSNAKSMENPAFRAIFKLIVQERFSAEFAGVVDLKKEVSKVRAAVSRLK